MRADAIVVEGLAHTLIDVLTTERNFRSARCDLRAQLESAGCRVEDTVIGYGGQIIQALHERD
jgi:hypothetical protein